MTETTEFQLSTAINKMVEEKTFSLDALNAVNTLREQALDLEKKLRYALANVESGKQDRSRLEYKISQFEADAKKLDAREAALATREAVMLNLEKGTAVAQAQFGVLDGVFKTIFTNRGVREMVCKSVPVAVPGGNGCTGYVTNHTETTTTETAET